MNEFQSIDSGAGLLKNDYGDSPIALAIKARLKKKQEKRDLENNPNEETEND